MASREKEATPTASSPEKRRWTEPTLRLMGTVGELLHTGGGKLSVTGGDPGEMRKQMPAD